MDVKPSNIFIDLNGTFFLGDFGSVRKLGESIKSSTEAFVPFESNSNVASVEYDYWMLAVTVFDIMAPTDVARAGTGTTPRPTKEAVCARLRAAHFAVDAAAVMNRITDDGTVLDHSQAAAGDS